MNNLSKLDVKIFADGADINAIKKLSENPLVKGFTTNPTLMRNAGVDNYEAFAKEVLEFIIDKPVSFEVFSDDIDSMERQALKIASWGENVNVKIPITNTKGESTVELVGSLSNAGVAVNVTAIMTLDQVHAIANVLNKGVFAIVSVFAGRIADTGIDPIPLMTKAAQILLDKPKADLLWASPRELLNIFHADECGCGIITVTPDLLSKLSGVGKNLEQFSLETVQMFYNDAAAAGYSINTDS